MSTPATPKTPSRGGRAFNMANGSPEPHGREHLIVSATPSQRIKTDGSQNQRPSNYILGECLGKGAFATVYKAMNYYTGEAVAIKQISIRDVPESEVKILMQEIDVVKELNHPNIVKYHGFEKSADYLNIILEFCETGSLRYLYKEYGKFPEHLVACFINQVLQGLSYLHDQGTIHRDIKGANILTTKGGTIKLADFGVAGKTNALNSQSVVGTPCWMAPEIIQMKGATTASDIWSLGCTIVELLTGKPPFHDRDPMSALYAIVKEDPPIPDNVSPQLNDFLLSCFAKEPYLRKTAKDLLEHQWIRSALEASNSHSQEPTKLHLHETIRTVKKYNSTFELRRHHAAKCDASTPVDENNDIFFEPNPLIQKVPNPFSPGKNIVKPDTSIYRDTEEDDFSDLVGELNIEKALSIVSSENTNRMRIRNSNDVEHIRKHAQHLERALPQKPIDIQQFVENDNQENDWDDYDLTGKELVTKVTRVDSQTKDIFSADLFMDLENESGDFEDSADRDAAREKLTSASKYMESLMSQITTPSSTDNFGLTIRNIYEVLREFPDTKNTIIKSHGLLSLKNALESKKSSREVINTLRVINHLCKDDYKTIGQFCAMGALRSITRYCDKDCSSHVQFQAEIFIYMLCAEKSGVDMFMSNNGLQYLAVLLRKLRANSSGSVSADVVIKAIFILHQILDIQNIEGRTITCYVMLSHHVVTSFVDVLRSKSVLNAFTGDAHAEMLSSIVNILLYCTEANQNFESAEFSNHRLYKALLSSYNLLTEEDQLRLLKFLKNISSSPYNHKAMEDGQVIPLLIRALENVKTDSERHQTMVWLILHTIFNLCELSPHRQEKAAACGLVPLLQRITDSRMQAREFALQLLFNMAFSTPLTRKYLAQSNVLATYIKLTGDPAWQLMAYRAVDAWLEAEVDYVQSHIIGNEYFQKQLVANLSQEVIEPFYKILCHSANICYVLSKQHDLYKYLCTSLRGRNNTEIQTVLLIIKVILGTRKSRIKELYLNNFESVLLPLSRDKQNVIGSSIAADIQRKIYDYKSQLRMH